METMCIDLQFETNPLLGPLGGKNKNTGDWFNVFNSCVALGPINLPLTEIPNEFQVATFGGGGGGVRVGFIGIVYGDPMVDVVVQLIGDCFNDSPTPIPCNADFFPEPGETSDFTLLQALLQGHTVEKPKGHYNKHRDRLDLVSPSKLTITAIQCLEGESLQGSPPVCST